MRLHSESKPKLAMPTKGVPSTFATSRSRSSPATATRAAWPGSFGTPSTRAKSLPRPQGAVATECDDGLAFGRRRSSLLVGVIDAARGHGAVLCTELVEHGMHLWKCLERSAPGGGG